MNVVFRFLIFSLLIGCRIINAQDWVELSGSLPESLSAQKYLVVGDVFVSPGSSLTIEAGAVFLFEGFTGLHVQGTVFVKGDAQKPVIFTSKNDKQYNSYSSVDAAPFDWNGVDVYESGLGSTFNHCLISYSVYGIRSQTEHFKVNSSIFSSNGKADLTVNGNRQDVSALTPFFYGLTPVNEPVKLPEPRQFTETPQKETETVTAVPAAPVSSGKRAGVQILRFTGLAVGIGAGVASVWYYTQRFKPAHERLEELSTLDDDEKWRYTSKDWDSAERERNRKLGICIAGAGGTLLGAGIFSISFAF